MGQESVITKELITGGGHVATGYVYKLDSNNSFDTSVKYLRNHLDGNSTYIDGNKIKFDKVVSSRVQLNEKWTHKVNSQINIISGLGYEYEFEGVANAKVDGYKVDSPKLRGSTGIGELTLNTKPLRNNDNLTVDLGVKGYFGKHRGANASLSLNYSF